MAHTNYSPMQGANMVNDTTLPEIWAKLHRLARGWGDLWKSDDLEYERRHLDRSSRELLSGLEAVPIENWCALSAATGWTAYSAIACSWCKDAEISHVWEGWETSGFPLKPLPEFERPARLLNPALLPKANSLSEIVEAGSNSHIAICAMLAALKEPLVFDMPREIMVKAPPEIAAFLHAKMRQVPQPDQELLTAWSTAFKDTEFDTLERV